MIRKLTLGIASLVAPFAVNAQCITSFPHNQPFTSGTVGVPGTLPTNWTNLSNDDLDWNVKNNGTNGSSNLPTGPYADRTLNNTTANAKFMYVESAGVGNTPNKVAILESPCFNISALGTPYLTFWYHMRGAQMGSLHVDVDANGTITSGVWNQSGDQGLYWKQGWLNLAPWAGQTNLRIRFRAFTGLGELSDIAIDDVFVGNLTPVFGCNEATAANYNAGVNVNNGTCDYSCGAGQKRVRIDIFHDSYPGETSWTLKNATTGATLASGTTSSSICVPQNTCLVFRINDSVGDGIWHNTYGYGQYFVWFDGALVKQGGQFGSFEETTFNCPAGFACSSAVPITLAPLNGNNPQTLATVTTDFLEKWYTFTPPQSGQYRITTCGSNTCDTKLWVYDMACNVIVLSDGIEGATFADDDEGGCGLQAVINANMPGGTLHRLRVGQNAGSCSGTVTFSIVYVGPVVGCMQSNMCNYNPLATIACDNCCIPFGNPDCPAGPDLVMNQDRLRNTLMLSTVNITDNCAPVEGCVRALGQRYVLRFATRIDNLGTTDYYIGSPSSQPQMFSYNNCHGHAHYEGYADYILFDQTGGAIPVGFKNGFCVIDVSCYPGGTGQYGCSNMGISKGCYDEYGTGTTCNWIDITDVPDGTYTLVVRTNWQHAPDALGRHEMNYANNYAQACITITRNAQNVPSFTQVTDCPTWVDCVGQAYGDARLDCNGVCNGPTKRGDLTGEGQQNQADAMEYVSRILGNDINPTSCNDLNDDTSITVTDACLMVNAYTRQATHDATGHVLHYHPWMDFPRGWVSIDDQVELSLGNLNPVAKTVDVLIRNPSARVMGYEFTMSGITIQSALNLAPNLVGDISLNTTLGGNKVIGISYVDSSLVKNSGFVPLARITYLALTGAEICISSIADIVNADANNVIATITNGCLAVPNTVALSPKVWLEGPYDASAQPPLMRDDLRAGGYLPALEPYTAMGYPHINGGGGEQIAAGVLGISGANAIVDFVVVELRSAATPAQVVTTRTALLQRDGDVVGMDGTSPVLLQAPPGNYHVAIRHRNHLGAMTASAMPIGTSPLTIDFRAGETATYGTEARKSEDGTMKLWAGNVVSDNRIMYIGGGNDRDPILVRVGGAVPTNIVNGYFVEDVNLSGSVKYTGASNDRDPILVNIGGVVPTNTRQEQLP